VCQLLYLQPITNLSFVGTSVFLMSLCQSSRPEVTVWNVSNLSMQWAYSIYAEAACCSPDGNEFAVLTLLSCPDGGTSTEQNGAILLFNAESPNPVASWSVKKARGGSISFVKGDVSSKDKETMLLVYVNGSHEYVIFDPRKREELVVSRNIDKKVQAEELGECVAWIVTLFLDAFFYTLLPRIHIFSTILATIVACYML